MPLHIFSSAILEMNKMKFAKYVMTKPKRMAINMLFLRIAVRKTS